MINKQQLRIGNYVNWDADKPIFTIEELRENIAFLKSDKMLVTAPYADLQPIALTSELLEKVGFKKYMAGQHDDLEMIGYRNGIFDVYHTEINSFHFADNRTEVSLLELKNLHTLQNVYFSLTGQELKQKTA